jgi:SMI1 / KNR4 family (SUKH-1)
VTSEGLDRVERELGIRLPGDYRALVLTYPVALGKSGPDYQLLDDSEQLIATNRLLREQGFFGSPWPAHFFSFGGDGLGNEYYLDLRKEPSPVYFADHEGTLDHESWPSLQAWLAERLQEQAEWEAEERRRAERRAARRWWQFWIS